MAQKLKCIMLIDDNPHDNFFHERIIKKTDVSEAVITKQTGSAAIEYLKMAAKDGYQLPDLIFLDINMPGMNGWEFLDAFKKLDQSIIGKVNIVMLTTSENPEDFVKAKSIELLSGFKSKPLTKQMLIDTLTRVI